MFPSIILPGVLTQNARYYSYLWGPPRSLVGNLNAATVDQNTGQITNPGDFLRILSTSDYPLLIQFVLTLNF